MSTVLAIPDLHTPFEHPDALAFCKAVRRAYKCDAIVCLGDEIDSHAVSDWPKNPDGFSAGHEHKRAVKALRRWFAAFPLMRLCWSNHTKRPWRVAYAAGLPKSAMKTVSEYLGAPAGWKWADEWEIDGVVYEHGDNLPGAVSGTHAVLKDVNYSVIFGHVHSKFSISWAYRRGVPQFAATPGCLIDPKAYAFNYFKGKHAPIFGVAVVTNGEPNLVRMKIDRAGRWTGTL